MPTKSKYPNKKALVQAALIAALYCDRIIRSYLYKPLDRRLTTVPYKTISESLLHKLLFEIMHLITLFFKVNRMSSMP